MKYYERITGSQYSNAKVNKVPFTTGELEQIESKVDYYNTFDKIEILFGSEHPMVVYSSDRTCNFRKFIYPKETNVIKIYHQIHEHSRYIYIYKNEDDWFYTASKQKMQISEHYSKCDQIDGLIQLMDTLFYDTIRYD